MIAAWSTQKKIWNVQNSFFVVVVEWTFVVEREEGSFEPPPPPPSLGAGLVAVPGQLCFSHRELIQ